MRSDGEVRHAGQLPEHPVGQIPPGKPPQEGLGLIVIAAHHIYQYTKLKAQLKASYTRSLRPSAAAGRSWLYCCRGAPYISVYEYISILMY